MIPQVFQLGPFPVNSFGLMVALAMLAGIHRLALSFKQNGIDPALAERYVFVAGFIGLVGARFWYMGETWEETRQDFWGALFSSAGFTFYGGFLLSTMALYLMARRDKLPIADFVDSLGPCLALGYAIGRVGCQLSGDGDYGVATTSPLGMSYALGVVPTPPGVLAYPTPVYESLLCMLILVVLLRIEAHPRWQVPFRRFSAYLVLIALERFSVEFLRINPKVLWGLSEAQVIALLLAGTGLALIILKGRAKREGTAGRPQLPDQP